MTTSGPGPSGPRAAARAAGRGGTPPSETAAPPAPWIAILAAVALLGAATMAGTLFLAARRLPLGLLLGSLVALGTASAALVGWEALEHARDARRRRADEAGAARWAERWRAVGRGEAPLPPPGAMAGDAGRGAAEALLGAHEPSPIGDPERRARLYADAGLLEADLAALRSRSARKRAQALDRLALLRHPGSFPALERAALHPDPATARHALLALARARARVPAPDEEIVASMIASIEASRAGRGTAEAALLLLERNAGPVIARMLAPAGREPRHDAALEALGKLGLHELAPLVGPWLRDPDPEIRAAAARALARLRRIPPHLAPDLLDLLSDGAWFVRAQAATALAAVEAGVAPAPPEELVVAALVRSLGDPSWWVRRSAAAALAARGASGGAALAGAAAAHDDPYARDAARRALEAPS